MEIDHAGNKDSGVSVSPSSNSGGRSRWCPTPEQVMLLEGMYKEGLKTPTTTQIQQITARLSLYGKIEGKNVFYWFQNHKARERQRLQKKLLAKHQLQPLYPPNYNSFYHHHHHLFPLQNGAGIVEDKSSCRNMVNEGNVDCSLMTVMMTESTSPYCIRVPPKTLQLFPTTPASPLNPSQRKSNEQDSDIRVCFSRR